MHVEVHAQAQHLHVPTGIKDSRTRPVPSLQYVPQKIPPPLSLSPPQILHAPPQKKGAAALAMHLAHSIATHRHEKKKDARF